MTGGGDTARENRPELLPSELPRSGATATVLVVLGIGGAFFPDQVPGLTIPTETTVQAMSM